MGLMKILGVKSKYCIECEKKLPFSLGSHEDIIEYKDGLRCIDCAKRKSSAKVEK